MGVRVGARTRTEYRPNSSADRPVCGERVVERPDVARETSHTSNSTFVPSAAARQRLDRCSAISHYLHCTTRSHYFEEHPMSVTTLQHGGRRLRHRPAPAPRRLPARDRPGARRGRRQSTARPPRPVPARRHRCVERARRRWFARNHPRSPTGCRRRRPPRASTVDDCSVSLDWLGTYDVPAGCSVAFYPGEGTKDGHGLLSRNFDFPTATFTQIVGAPSAARRATAGRRPVDRRAAPGRRVRLGRRHDHGRHGRHGRRQRGRAGGGAAGRQRDTGTRTERAATGRAVRAAGRALPARHCATVEEAKDALLAAKHYYFFTPCHFVVADRSGASFVWEHSPRRNLEVDRRQRR